MIVFLSTADTDLLALERARLAGADEGPGLPVVRAANPAVPGAIEPALAALRASTDDGAVVVLRLLGGRRACPSVVDSVVRMCRDRDVPLIAVSGDGRPDPELDAICSAPAPVVERTSAYLRHGGASNLAALLRYLSDTFLGTRYGSVPPTPQPEDGIYHSDSPPDAAIRGPRASFARRVSASDRPRIGVLFYRSHWLSGNLAFVDALVRALAREGCDALPVYCQSLRPPERGTGYVLERYFLDDDGRPAVDALISTLSFAASRLSTPRQGELEEATEAAGPAGAWFARLGVPVLQAIVCTDSREAWQSRAAGLSPPDVAMQVALPEFDGRIITVPVCFKEPATEGGARYTPDNERCAALARQAAAWARLRRLPNGEKRVAIVLGNSPSKNGRIGNAVGLDTPASLVALLEALRAAGYTVAPFPASGDELMHRLIDSGTYDVEFGASSRPSRSSSNGNASRAAPPGLRLGNVFVGVQPPRGWGDDPEAIYHDPELPPPPGYVAFYDWLRAAPPDGFGAHAMIHLGKHGTLEWLPGKSVGLSRECAPDSLLAELPLMYPFVVNDPGEGTQAKRRGHAVLIGHLVPPLAPAGTYGELAALERLIAEEREARTLDPARVPVVRRQVWAAIREARLEEELGLNQVQSAKCKVQSEAACGFHLGFGLGSPHSFVPLSAVSSPLPLGEGMLDADFDGLLARVEGYLDELQRATIRDGLHVLGRPPDHERRETLLDAMVRLAPDGEMGALRAKLDRLLDRTSDELGSLVGALAGRYVAPGPSGAPTRGAWNVLPTGRNLYSVDPQAIPSPAAWEMGRRLADALVERHLAETGSYPRTVGLVVWGTAAMRTHGDDVAQALALLGVRPVWQRETGRVTGVEPVPPAELGRPRIDVTLHISGFFRDAFPHLIDLLDRAVQLVAALDEPDEHNYVAAHVRRDAERLLSAGEAIERARRRASYRVFGSKPSCYGAGLLPLLEQRNWRHADDLARAYETWSSYAYGQETHGAHDGERFRACFAAIDVAAKNQDNREHDLFDSDDYFQYHGGMVAAVRALRGDGTAPRAYFGDSADPARPAVRSLAEEARRVYRSRVVNPRWLAAMRRHGYKGAFEMAATVDYLFGYDATTGVAADWMYERLAAAYVFDPEQRAFFARSNPWAFRDVTERLLEAAARGLWERPSPETLAQLRRAYLETEGDLEARQQAVGSQLVKSEE